jgi:hypothetical protein
MSESKDEAALRREREATAEVNRRAREKAEQAKRERDAQAAAAERARRKKETDDYNKGFPFK